MATPRFINEILGFANNSRNVLSVKDQEIYSFVKEINSSNSARPLNRKMLIPLNLPQSFKSVICRLKDRKMCGVIPNGLVLQEINIPQLNVMRKERK